MMDIIEFWKDCRDKKLNIHPEDKAVLGELSGLLDFNYDFPPGPYFGPIKTAKVILCYANPSINRPSLKTISVPSHNAKLFEQLSGEEPYPYDLDGWKSWFSQRANSIYGGQLDAASKNLAIFNLIPYASETMDIAGKHANCLPSAWAAQEYLRRVLITKAKKGEILLVMCRSNNLWGLKTSLGCENIVINKSRNGFSTKSKEIIGKWLRNKAKCL
ncbi:hypothetical protein [Pseudoalteromonas ardens]|uniref:hypothetical protein n=1 Tax=Pseudoalteromonas ardens TaxID=3048490 RepID=UPI0024C3BB53|nr:hypothetical protein [Pseudoalteromonas sp. R96]MDK1310578.1 hypothetical protein [Pseudoalteromonas sp. R96]